MFIFSVTWLWVNMLSKLKVIAPRYWLKIFGCEISAVICKFPESIYYLSIFCFSFSSRYSFKIPNVEVVGSLQKYLQNFSSFFFESIIRNCEYETVTLVTSTIYWDSILVIGVQQFTGSIFIECWTLYTEYKTHSLGT